ncbi:MAG: hypothetical protein ACYDCP_09965 [Thermoplasmataceae archaeon]
MKLSEFIAAVTRVETELAADYPGENLDPQVVILVSARSAEHVGAIEFDRTYDAGELNVVIKPAPGNHP